MTKIKSCVDCVHCDYKYYSGTWDEPPDEEWSCNNVNGYANKEMFNVDGEFTVEQEMIVCGTNCKAFIQDKELGLHNYPVLTRIVAWESNFTLYRTRKGNFVLAADDVHHSIKLTKEQLKLLGAELIKIADDTSVELEECDFVYE
jgi:hypothetical protein